MKENKFKPGDLVTFEPTSDLGLDLGYAGKTCVVLRELRYGRWSTNYEVLVDGHIIEVQDTWIIGVEDERK